MSTPPHHDRPSGDHDGTSHGALVAEQFSLQAERFARSPELHGDDMLALLVDAAAPKASDESLDVACGPGTIVAAFAPRLRRAVGLDGTDAMLAQARALASERNLTNVEWRLGDVYSLPFADDSFDIVSCRFAFHHFEHPASAFAEMVRVCRRCGRIVLCDAVTSSDPAKAAAFNAMERHRDPSTTAFRPLDSLIDLFVNGGLPTPTVSRFLISHEPEQLIRRSFPVGGDYDALRQMIDGLIAADAMDIGPTREAGKFSYPCVVLTAAKP